MDMQDQPKSTKRHSATSDDNFLQPSKRLSKVLKAKQDSDNAHIMTLDNANENQNVSTNYQRTLDNVISGDYGRSRNVLDSSPTRRKSSGPVALSAGTKGKAKKSKKMAPKKPRNSGSGNRKLKSKPPKIVRQKGRKKSKSEHAAELIPPSRASKTRSAEREASNQDVGGEREWYTMSRPNSADKKKSAKDELSELRESYNSIQPIFDKDNSMAFEQRADLDSMKQEIRKSLREAEFHDVKSRKKAARRSARKSKKVLKMKSLKNKVKSVKSKNVTKRKQRVSKPKKKALKKSKKVSKKK